MLVKHKWTNDLIVRLQTSFVSRLANQANRISCVHTPKTPTISFWWALFFFGVSLYAAHDKIRWKHKSWVGNWIIFGPQVPQDQMSNSKIPFVHADLHEVYPFTIFKYFPLVPAHPGCMDCHRAGMPGNLELILSIFFVDLLRYSTWKHNKGEIITMIQFCESLALYINHWIIPFPGTIKVQTGRINHVTQQ